MKTVFEAQEAIQKVLTELPLFAHHLDGASRYRKRLLSEYDNLERLSSSIPISHTETPYLLIIWELVKSEPHVTVLFCTVEREKKTKF